MALIARVSRLFKADLHAVLDRLEEPVSLLKQSIREMEEALAARERDIEGLRAKRLTLDKCVRNAHALTAELDRQLDLCFAGANEELARKLVRRKLRSEKTGAAARERLEAVRDRLSDAEAALERERDALEHMRQKVDCFATPGPELHRDATGEPLDVADDEVEVAYLRERQRRVTS
jgi:phage shock protein A